MCGMPGLSPEDFCRRFSQRFGWEAVAITRGAAGSVALIGGEYVEAHSYEVAIGDPVGAGRRIRRCTFLHGLSSGWAPDQIVDFSQPGSCARGEPPRRGAAMDGRRSRSAAAAVVLFGHVKLAAEG